MFNKVVLKKKKKKTGRPFIITYSLGLYITIRSNHLWSLQNITLLIIYLAFFFVIDNVRIYTKKLFS